MNCPYSVSFVLIAYNQEAFIKEACEAALNQMGEPIEIILSDDCSTDDTFQIMQDVVRSYKGSHRVLLNRTVRNVGLIEHINQVVELSSGDVIVYAAGDDISLPNRVIQTLQMFESAGRSPLLIHSSVQEINEQGVPLGLVHAPVFGKRFDCVKMAQKYSLVIGATCAWHRSIWQQFGRLIYATAYEDAVMALRACMMGGEGALLYSESPLVEYRVNVAGVSQGGRYKPKTRIERQKFELKRLQTRSAICAQRLDDSLKFGAWPLVDILKQEQANNEVIRWVYEKQTGWLSLIKIGLKKHAVIALMKAILKRLRTM